MKKIKCHYCDNLSIEVLDSKSIYICDNCIENKSSTIKEEFGLDLQNPDSVENKYENYYSNHFDDLDDEALAYAITKSLEED